MYFVLVNYYSWLIPPFEAPDAYFHFAVIEYIARTGEFPPRDNPREYAWRQMVYHAPLYYYASGLLISPINTDDFLIRYPLNPHAQIGESTQNHNYNFTVHADDSLYGTGLAVRVVRGFSMVLGAITLASVWILVRQVIPTRKDIAFIAVLVMMFNPQFLFLSGVINNDNLVTALSTVSLAMVCWMIRHGLSWKTLIFLSLVPALGSLSKANGLAVYPVVMLALLWVVWRDSISLRRLAQYFVVIGFAWLVIAGWWYYGNWQMFGDPTGSSLVAEATGLRGVNVDIVGELRGLFYSFWGVFGWFNILAPQVFYQWVGLLCGIGTIGYLVWLVRHKHDRNQTVMLTLLMIYAVTLMVNWWRFNTQVLAAQGRLLFPLLGVFVLILSIGLSQPYIRYIRVLLLGGLAFFALLLPALRIAPAYAKTPQIPVAEWQAPEDAIAIDFREPWQEEACLRVWLSPLDLEIGDSEIRLDYYWQGLCQMTGYWSVFLHFSDLALESCTLGDTSHIGSQVDMMPDRGNTPVPAIREGYVLADSLTIPVPEGIDYSREWHLQTGLYDAGGTFIRAFVSSVEDNLAESDVTIGRCSAEVINVRLVNRQ